MQRIVLTGGPCAGKTSLIKHIESQNHSVFEEVARVVIQEQLLIESDALPWKNVSKFSALVLERQIHDFNKAQTNLNFYDRGIPDLIGYMNHGNFPLFQSLAEEANKRKYNSIFVLPPWEEIYVNDNERKESFEDAQKIHQKIIQAYRNLNYQPIEVPLDSIENRYQFILNNL